jgi:hypothetical protein
MALDPVHVDGIARLAGRISTDVDERDHRELAETAWAEFFDPLRRDGTAILEPLAEQRRYAVDVEAAALEERPYPSQHGIDAGTIGPTTYENGLVIDVAQAAMAAAPSDLALHRARTVVMATHSTDASLALPDDWTMDDEGYLRKRILQTPRVDRYEGDVVHALALYLAEGTHAVDNADVVEDLLYLDGPLYPTGVLQWADHDPALGALLHEDDVQAVVANYVDLVERFVERDVPVVGFVKSSATKAITRALREATGSAPWANDAALWTQLLADRDDDGAPRTDRLTCTNWFRSRAGTDAVVSREGDALGIERALDPTAYEVTFFAVCDPREDLVFRVEAPAALTEDPDRRARLRKQVLADVAAERGPPRAVAKADELARMGTGETVALREAIEARLDSERQTTYDDTRWGVAFEGL